MRPINLLGKGPPQQILKPLISLFNQGEYEQVMKKASGLKKEFPNSFMIFNILGAAHKGLGNLHAAELYFRKACKLNPLNPDSSDAIFIYYSPNPGIEVCVGWIYYHKNASEKTVL